MKFLNKKVVTLCQMLCMVLFIPATFACSSNDSGGGSRSPKKDEAANGKQEKAKKKPTDKESANAPTDNSDDDENENGGALTELTCTDHWLNYLKHNDIDEFIKLKSTSTLNRGITISTQTVIAKSEDSVTWRYENDIEGRIVSYENIVKKDEYISSCENIPEVESIVLEEGEEAAVAVEAGTFDTHWIKSKVERDGSESITTTWTAALASGDVILVKSESESSFSGIDFVSKTELIGTNKN